MGIEVSAFIGMKLTDGLLRAFERHFRDRFQRRRFVGVVSPENELAGQRRTSPGFGLIRDAGAKKALCAAESLACRLELRFSGDVCRWCEIVELALRARPQQAGRARDPIQLGRTLPKTEPRKTLESGHSPR